MTVLGSIIKDDQIIGITILTANSEGHDHWYEFEILTIGGGKTKFCTSRADGRYNSSPAQAEMKFFAQEYVHIRSLVAELTGEQEEEFEYHAIRVENHFNFIAEQHRQLEDALKASKGRNKDNWITLLNNMRPHIIALKHLAE